MGSATKSGIGLLKNASESKLAHFCTGDPDYYPGIMGSIGDKSNVALDPSQETYRFWNEDRLKAGLSRADALFCNEYEARTIEERTGVDSVFELDMEIVVMIEGEKGSKALVGREVIEIPCVPSECVANPTGCGDSYRAGFNSGPYHGYSLEESLVLGSSTASFVIEGVGALSNIPTWEMVEERAKPYFN